MAAHPSETKQNFFTRVFGSMLFDEPQTEADHHAHEPQLQGNPRVLRVNAPAPRHTSVFYYPKNWDDILLAANDLKLGNEVVINVTRLNGPIRDHALCYLRGAVDMINAPWRQASDDVFQFGVPGTAYTNATEAARATKEADYFATGTY